MNFTFWVSELQEGHEVTFHFQGQRDLVRNEWQKFLNLCICQETHLDNVEEYKKVYMPLFTQSAFQSLRVENTWLLLSTSLCMAIQMFETIIVLCHSPVPNGHRAPVRDTDQTQQQPGPQECQQKEQLGDTAAARGTQENLCHQCYRDRTKREQRQKTDVKIKMCKIL